jgi:hypothetical protein
MSKHERTNPPEDQYREWLQADAAASRQRFRRTNRGCNATASQKTGGATKEHREQAAKNRALILMAIRNQPNIGQIELAEVTGLPINSVRNYLGWLVSRGYAHGVSGKGYVEGKRP